MMGYAAALAMALLSESALAAPLEGRQAPGVCGAMGPTATQNVGNFVLNNNVWDVASVAAPAPGQTTFQCTAGGQPTNNGNTISWSSQFSWPYGSQNGDPISYANAAAAIPNPIPLVNAVQSIQSTVSYNYAPTTPIGDVAYDMFTAAVPGQGKYPTGDFEIMVWLDRWSPSAGPTINPKSDGTNQPVTTGVSIAGQTFDFWYGVDSNQETFTFVASPALPGFTGDLNLFIQHIISTGNYPQFDPTVQHLTAVQFGSEVWTGATTFSVPEFSATVAV